MWKGNNYRWVVLCKNDWFRWPRRLFNKDRIPLAQKHTGETEPAPRNEFNVGRDERPNSEVFKFSQELPVPFTPLFQLQVMTSAAERRRSRRFCLDAGLVIRGVSFEKGSFQEAAITASVNAHGALVLMSAKVAKGQTLFLKNSVSQNELQVRVVRLAPHSDTVTRVGVEFAEPSFGFWPSALSPNLQTSVSMRSPILVQSFALT